MNKIQLNTSQYYLPYKSIFEQFALKNKQNSPLHRNNADASLISVQNKKESNPGLALGITGMITGVLLLGCSRGVQKGAAKYMGKLKDFIEYKLELSNLNNSRSSKFYEHALKGLNTFIKKTEAINNITSVKDILFMKLMYKTEPTKKLHKFISDVFENMSRKTVVKSYKNTKQSFDKMYRIFDKLDNYILENSPDEIVEFKGKNYTKKELVAKAKEHRETAKIVVENFINPDAMKNRYAYIKAINSKLYSSFWDASFKDFWSSKNKFRRKEMWQTFIAAEQIQGDKTLLAGNIALARNVITYTGNDKTKVISEYIAKLSSFIPENDIEGEEIIKRLEWFANNPEGLKNNKELFLKELNKLSEHKVTDKISPELVKEHEAYKQSHINSISEMAEDESTGEIQDMLSIYYKIAPFELSKSGAAIAVQNAVKSFDKSVNTEIVEFFDKVRDLAIGSAPTDILTVVLSTMMILRGLEYAHNDDEKISVMLTSGIPVAGALATSIGSATKLVSGGKSLALGFISGIILNQIGKVSDKYRIKFLNSKKQVSQNIKHAV